VPDTVGQRAVDDQADAITALPALRRRLDLDGATATSDAPGGRAALGESSLLTVLDGLHR